MDSPFEIVQFIILFPRPFSPHLETLDDKLEKTH